MKARIAKILQNKKKNCRFKLLNKETITNIPTKLREI